MDSLILKIFSNLNNSIILNVLLAKFIFFPKIISDKACRPFGWPDQLLGAVNGHQFCIHEIMKPGDAKIN